MKTFLGIVGSVISVLIGIPVVIFGLAMIPVIFMVALAVFLFFMFVFLAMQLLGIPIPVYHKLSSGRKVQIGEFRRFKFIPF